MEERRILIGNPVSKGVAKAEAYHYEPLLLNVEERYFKPGKETAYWKAFLCAREKAKNELQELEEKVSVSDEKAAAVFAFHREILEDEDLIDEIQTAILRDCMYPELAIESCFGQYIANYQQAEDLLVVRHAMDMYDVKHRLLRNYLGKVERSLSQLEKDVIVVAENLLPSDIATIDMKHIKGIILEKNVSNSHAAVIARVYEIPMINGVENAREVITDGAMISMDAVTGKVLVFSDAEE